MSAKAGSNAARPSSTDILHWVTTEQQAASAARWCLHVPYGCGADQMEEAKCALHAVLNCTEGVNRLWRILLLLLGCSAEGNVWICVPAGCCWEVCQEVVGTGQPVIDGWGKNMGGGTGCVTMGSVGVQRGSKVVGSHVAKEGGVGVGDASATGEVG